MNRAIALTQTELQEVILILTHFLPASAKVWLFGSRAKGTAKRFSDIDLGVDLQAPLSLSILAKLMEAFDESKLPYKVDIVDMRSVSDAFCEEILKNGIELQLMHDNRQR